MSIRAAIARTCLKRLAVLRGPVTWLVACWLMAAVGFQVLGAQVQTGGLPTHSMHSEPSMVPIVDHDTATDEHHHGDGAHHHTGDALTDLLTLGHSHVAGGCAGVLPSGLCLVAAILPAAPIVPWHEHGVFLRPPSTPFRPPIV